MIEEKDDMFAQPSDDARHRAVRRDGATENGRHRIALFGYDFPHVKTCDFMLALKAWGYDVVCVLAAPWRKLNITRSELRVAVKREPPFHPLEMAKLLNIPYYSVKHNSKKLRQIVKKHRANLGIISGARILKQKTIDALDHGIINLHPGLIAENRGLDSLKWAIYLDLPQAVTSHFIDAEIDAGYVVEIERVPMFTDDTLFDINQRISDVQLGTLITTLRKIEGKTWRDFPAAEVSERFRRGESWGESRKAIPPEKEESMKALMKAYLHKWASTSYKE